MLRRRAKAYSSSCSQTVNLSPAIYSFVIDVDTTKKLVTTACSDKQHVHAYLRPFTQKTGEQR